MISSLIFRHRRDRCIRASLLWLVASALAAEPAADKSGYSLAEPVPAKLLREMSTDRPDVTESPFTVDAGHLQLEMDLANATRNHLDGTRTTAWGVAAFNLRLGVFRNFETGIFVAPWTRTAEKPRGGRREVHSGFGDITLRAKQNFWGNDGGDSAGGLILDCTLPTAASGMGVDAVEGMVFLPLSFDLGGGWELGAMTAVNLRKIPGAGRRAVLIDTITVGRDITKNVGIYFEITSEAGDGTHAATFDTGLTFRLNPNVQFDCGINLGLSRAADDILCFVGLARRF